MIWKSDHLQDPTVISRRGGSVHSKCSVDSIWPKENGFWPFFKCSRTTSAAQTSDYMGDTQLRPSRLPSSDICCGVDPWYQSPHCRDISKHLGTSHSSLPSRSKPHRPNRSKFRGSVSRVTLAPSSHSWSSLQTVAKTRWILITRRVGNYGCEVQIPFSARRCAERVPITEPLLRTAPHPSRKHVKS